MRSAYLLFALPVVVALQQQPIFRGSTDVVVVDVQVVDHSGTPISDLTPADFELKVDGKPRPITQALFQRVSDRVMKAAPGQSASMTTLTDPSAVVPPAPSYVMFVVDPWAMRPEPSRILFDQAAQFMDTLPAAHVVGLLVVPALRPTIPFTDRRKPVAIALERELGSYSGDSVPQSQAIASIASIEAGIDALREVDGRRTLVYFGDVFGAGELNAKEVAFHATMADVAIYVVSSDAMSMVSAAQRQPPRAQIQFGGSDALAMLADLTGGAYLRRVVNGAQVFDNLERELSAQYVLSFDVISADRNGKRHKIDVKVNRKGVSVRFRQEFVR